MSLIKKFTMLAQSERRIRKNMKMKQESKALVYRDRYSEKSITITYVREREISPRSL